ncbi:aminoglycoside 3'-phosphotransferase [Phytoactinopolyspora limicola]|uniref:aminoglycoside 3'-phosphotransferase n=1 Tax=Phytoactinopolyspora limicola TaxID=2715536 RepID=UPI00140774B9|nr:aminoglycoside 3'-phosphotransferase [Phytoactinopolyspora limicola]
MSQRVISGVPTGPVVVPTVIKAIAEGDTITPVWENELGGLTFRLDGGGGARYAKWLAAGTPEIDLAAEAARLRWARRWARVPEVIDHGADDAGSWLVTAAEPGRSAVDPVWVADPTTAATAIGRGLRILHDALPVDECPFDWSVEHRLASAWRFIEPDGDVSDGPEPNGRDGISRAEALARLGEPPPIDRLVVCHGDACAPNTLIHDDGTFAAHVDLGALGVADRWADLAIASWSTVWNYGAGYEEVVYAGYGIDADPARISYYRLLWDLT